MSRHKIQLENNLEFVYGYDRPLQGYFWQMYGPVVKAISGRDSEDPDNRRSFGLIEESPMRINKNSLYEKMAEIGIKRFPDDHVFDVAMDLPIRD